MTKAELEFVASLYESFVHARNIARADVSVELESLYVTMNLKEQVLQLFEYCVANGVNFAGCMK